MHPIEIKCHSFNLKKQQPSVILQFCLSKTWAGSIMITVTSSFTKSYVLKVFSVHTKARSQRFQKFRFEWTVGLVWMVSLPGEITLHIQIPPGFCGPGFSYGYRLEQVSGIFVAYFSSFEVRFWGSFIHSFIHSFSHSVSQSERQTQTDKHTYLQLPTSLSFSITWVLSL